MKKWTVGKPDMNTVKKLMTGCGVTGLAACVLAQRGYTSPELVAEKLDSGELSDPFLLRDMQEAADAEGKHELLQIQAQIDALAEADRAQMTGLSTACNAIRHLRHKQELDDAVEFEKSVEWGRVIIADPFDKEAADAAGFQRPVARGFVSF